jgi:peptidoglycan/LPS O-acetylase OafA/YrhL
LAALKAGIARSASSRTAHAGKLSILHVTPNHQSLGFDANASKVIVQAAAPLESLIGKSARIPELDGFRGLAILLVVTGHTLNFTLHFLPYAGLKMGEAGVLLFFVLSGYLITGLLRDESKRTGTISLGAFYTRRACRLLPALGIFLAGVALLHSMGLITGVPGRDFVAAIFYVRNIFGKSLSLEHLWSLSLEEQFYTLWPFLFVWLGARRMLRVALGLCVLVMVWRGTAISLHLWDYNTGVFYVRPWFRFDAIAVGCCLALVPLPKSPKWVFGFSAAALMGWSLFGEQLSRPLFITLQTILAASLLFSVIQGGSLTRGFFSLSWLRWLGGISYSLYLWQQIFTVTALSLGWIRQFPLNILAAITLAVLSRHLVEQPFLELGRRHLANRRRKIVSEPVLL